MGTGGCGRGGWRALKGGRKGPGGGACWGGWEGLKKELKGYAGGAIQCIGSFGAVSGCRPSAPPAILFPAACLLTPPPAGPVLQEPLFVPRPGATAEDDGWIILGVHDAGSRTGKGGVVDLRVALWTLMAAGSCVLGGVCATVPEGERESPGHLKL